MIEKGKQALDIPESVPLDCVVSTDNYIFIILYTVTLI